MRVKYVSSALWALSILGLTSIHSQAKTKTPALSLAEQLSRIHQEVEKVRDGMVTGLKVQSTTKLQLRKVQRLMKLQKQERDLGKKRLGELERTVLDLESRKGILRERLDIQKSAIRSSLGAIEASTRGVQMGLSKSHLSLSREQVEAPRRKVMTRLVDRGLKEVETLKADLVDASQLEGRIQEEREQLAYLFQDLKEQEGVMVLNHQLYTELLKKSHHDHIYQWERYGKLKNAESQVESLIRNLNVRKELGNVTSFAKLKGRLPLPVSGGKIVAQFGRIFDLRSRLHVFKNGIDIATQRREVVQAVSQGKVAYAGDLPSYGSVVIIDHGEHFYSLYAHLSEISKETNETVVAGDPIGKTSDSDTPLYFEIRSRNVAVNPLQWVLN